MASGRIECEARAGDQGMGIFSNRRRDYAVTLALYHEGGHAYRPQGLLIVKASADQLAAHVQRRLHACQGKGFEFFNRRLPLEACLHELPSAFELGHRIVARKVAAGWPRGFALNITDSIFRSRYRHSFESPSLIEDGEIFSIIIEPFATANLFKKGHRIRLDISSSNFPKFDVNPNTGGPEGLGRNRVIARNTVFCDAIRASRLWLPVLETV
ncbi:MAG: antibiotic hydrolase [Hyphomicrobiales bacterium]|nr:antibiotic hydrolase [Hyphomicrobiales bacterium]